MTSYRNGQPTGFTKSRLGGSVLLGSRDAAAGFANKHVNTVRRYCVPIACDVNTRADLYDLDFTVRQFKAMKMLCCIPDSEGDACGSPVMRNAPYPLCVVHAHSVAEFFSKQNLVELAHARLIAQQGDEPALLPGGEPRASVVYYVQIDTVIKIGTTVDIRQRMNAYPPYARLLATEPGGYTLERKRHRQFNEYLRAGNEWFDIGPRLRHHVEHLMELSGVSA